MRSYLILRLADSKDPRDATIAQLVTTDTVDLQAITKQGYDGAARYAVLDWDARTEFDLGPGAIEARPPTDT